MNIPGFLGGDRTSLDLPEPQENLVKAVIATGKPVVVVLTSGSAIAANSAAEHAAALLAAWYGGEEAGTAIAETLAGINNPAGRLPVTFYKSVDQLPPFTDYAMKGRTYRYFKGEPLYPFGFGLSYSTFEYSGLAAKRTPKGAEIRATVKNTSARDGDEVVQLYVGGGPEEEAPDTQPARIPADPPACGREPRGDVHDRLRRPAEVRGGGQRRRRTARGQRAARSGQVVEADRTISRSSAEAGAWLAFGATEPPWARAVEGAGCDGGPGCRSSPPVTTRLDWRTALVSLTGSVERRRMISEGSSFGLERQRRSALGPRDRYLAGRK